MYELSAGSDRLVHALWHISDDREKLERIRVLLDYATAEQLQQDITAAKNFISKHLNHE